jgi:ABC-2 type transport system permease protein
MDRWPIVVGAWLASITVSLPLTMVPLIASSIALDGGSDLVAATAVAGTVGVIAYSAVFVLIGLLLKNAIVWGLGYILIWEGIVAAFGTFAARLAIRGYTRSIITAITDIDLDLGDLSLAAGIVVPLMASVGALALASYRLRVMDVA